MPPSNDQWMTNLAEIWNVTLLKSTDWNASVECSNIIELWNLLFVKHFALWLSRRKKAYEARSLLFWCSKSTW
jgi:hypothetical protein